METKQSVWKNYSLKGALFLFLLFFIVILVTDMQSERKSWDQAFTSTNLIIKAIASLLGGFIMEYAFVKWGKKRK